MGKTKFIYTTQDVCSKFQLTAPRLLQLRNGQTVKVKRTIEGKLVECIYEFPPILVQGEDFIWDGSIVMFSESSITKIKNKKRNRKFNIKSKAIPSPSKEKVKKEEGLLEVKNLADKLKLTVQNIYAMRDISKKNIANSKYHSLVEDQDWKHINGKVFITKEGVEKIKENIKIKRNRKELLLEKNAKITIIHKSNVFTISGELAFKIAEMVNASAK